MPLSAMAVLLTLVSETGSVTPELFPLHFREGSEITQLRRIAGGSAPDRGLYELRRGGHVWQAEVGREAIVQTASGSAPEIAGVTVLRPLMPSVGLYLVADETDGVALAQRLEPLVEEGLLLSAAPDQWLERVPKGIHVPPNDEHFGGQWYLTKAKVDEAWTISTGSPDTVIAVLDDGCDANHPDLKDHLLPGRDVVSQDDDPSFVPNESGNEHGTACAGIVAAVSDNSIGIAGTCPDCRVRCIRLLPGETQRAPISADVDAFQFALQSNVAVTSNSWGYKQHIPAPSATAAAIRALETQGRAGLGTVVVFAAGNDARELQADEIEAIENVINVGAVNNFDEAAPFSNSGESVALAAPTGTYTLDVAGADGLNSGDYTALFGGTSSACPVVAGIAALLLSAHPEFSAADVRRILKETARPAPFATPDENGHDKLYGYGIVDAHAALTGLVASDGGVGTDGGTSEPVPVGCRCDASGAAVWWLLGLLVATRRRLTR